MGLRDRLRKRVKRVMGKGEAAPVGQPSGARPSPAASPSPPPPATDAAVAEAARAEQQAVAARRAAEAAARLKAEAAAAREAEEAAAAREAEGGAKREAEEAAAARREAEAEEAAKREAEEAAKREAEEAAKREAEAEAEEAAKREAEEAAAAREAEAASAREAEEAAAAAAREAEEAVPPAPAPSPALVRSTEEPEIFESERAALEQGQKIMSVADLLNSDEDEHADAPTRNAHYRQTFESTDAAFSVRVRNDEEFLDMTFPCEPGEYVLEAAERAGYDLPFSCRSGGCLSCSAMTVSGTWEMGEQYVLEDEHIEQGFMLMCCSTVTSDAEFISHQEDNVV